MCPDTLMRVKTCFIRQDERGIKKECFTSSGGDLTVRRTASKEVVGFELTCERPHGTLQDYVWWAKGHPVRTGIADPAEGAARARSGPPARLHSVPDPGALRRAAAFVSDRRRKLTRELRDFLLERLRLPAR